MFNYSGIEKMRFSENFGQYAAKAPVGSLAQETARYFAQGSTAMAKNRIRDVNL